MAIQAKARAERNLAESIGLGAVPDQNRQRRVPEVAAGLLLVVVCALGALWWQAAGSATHSVLVLRHAVERGEVISAGDLQIVNVNSDAAIASMTESEVGLVVGRTALNGLPAGTIVVASQFSSRSLIGLGEGVVGLALEAGEFPSLGLAMGDTVGVVLTPAVGDPRGFGADVEINVLVPAAIVVEVASIGVQGHMFVSIQVGEADAARIASAASANRVRLIEVAGERE